VQRWKEYLVSVYQRIVDDVLCSARHQFLPHKPVLLCVMLSSVPTIPACLEAEQYLYSTPSQDDVLIQDQDT